MNSKVIWQPTMDSIVTLALSLTLLVAALLLISSIIAPDPANAGIMLISTSYRII